MPTRTFSSFEPFFEAIRHSNLRAMVLESDRGNWVLTNLLLSKLSVQIGQATGNALVQGSPLPGGISIFFLTQGLSAMSGNGCRFDECTMLVGKPGDEFCLAAHSPRRWCSVYIANQDLASVSGQPAAALSSRSGLIQLEAHQMVRFRSVIQGLEDVVQQAPDAFNSPVAQDAAWQKLIPEICTVLALPHAGESPLGRPTLSRREIILRSMEFLAQHDGEYLSVGQLAASAGVSERTLRDSYQQYFGVSPVQYLNRRTLHKVRNALKNADPSLRTITRIAADFGVWQLGRFARDYRSLFGELPSETLRRKH
jgi:AraC family transcriptional regulator, ethanolamine operon transcriptional activator